MELEALAHQYGPAAALADGFRLNVDGVLDLLPTLAWLADGVAPGVGAAVFHATLTEALAPGWTGRGENQVFGRLPWAAAVFSTAC